MCNAERVFLKDAPERSGLIRQKLNLINLRLIRSRC